MDYAIRHMRKDEWPLLEDFLYRAIFVPEGYEGSVRAHLALVSVMNTLPVYRRQGIARLDSPGYDEGSQYVS